MVKRLTPLNTNERAVRDHLAPEPQLWEDGMRTDASAGTFEWWYFDSQFSDGSTMDVTLAAVWSSSNTSIATMTTPRGAGRAPARRNRPSRVRFSTLSKAEATPLPPMKIPERRPAARKAPVSSHEPGARSIGIYSPKRESRARTLASPHCF